MNRTCKLLAVALATVAFLSVDLHAQWTGDSQVNKARPDVTEQGVHIIEDNMSRARLLLLSGGLLLLRNPLFARHRYVTTKPNYVDEAYKVYSAILPTIGQNPLVIGTETRTPEICLQRLDAQSENVLRSAIDNYLEPNALPWQLQKHFDINRHYERLAEEELKATFQNGMNGSPAMGGWKTFYERHPGSEGLIELSAVGFNADKTIAVVFIGYHCGEECRGGEFRALENKGGKWQLLIGGGLWNHCVWYVRDRRARRFPSPTTELCSNGPDHSAWGVDKHGGPENLAP